MQWCNITVLYFCKINRFDGRLGKNIFQKDTGFVKTYINIPLSTFRYSSQFWILPYTPSLKKSTSTCVAPQIL